MKPSSYFLLITIFLGAFRFGQAQEATEIVRQSDLRMRGKTMQALITMQIIRPKWNRSLSFKTWNKGQAYSLILVTAPARDKGQSFLKRNREMWNWQPSINRNVKLPSSLMGQSWMGSDFKNEDFIRESSLVHDYTHKILGSEKIGERDCYKIQLLPKPEAAVVWGKILLWISKTDFLQLKTEMYDEEGELVNTLQASQIKLLGGRNLPAYLEMIPADKPGHKTVIEYQSIVFDQELADDFFSIQQMKTIR
ncbi:MAG: outer membrane lipoprotein-sorting protein [Microscillaceae bacterium]|nr:outer membrane lipoprotein-sorting protein [Microscillaceae bacterium]